MTDYRLITFETPGGARAGLAVGDLYVDAAQATGVPGDASMQAILDDWQNATVRLGHAAATFEGGRPIGEARLVSPVYFPVTIYCAGANYSDHAARMAEKMGVAPEPDPRTLGLKSWHFIKPSRTAVGDGASVSVSSAALDWEAELAVVIGRPARHVTAAAALGHVAGYTMAIDLSARDLSRRPHVAATSPFKYDWVGQKCFDGCCPLGPALVPAAQVPDPQALSIKLWVNDELRQDSSTAKMIFSVAEQIEHLSSRLTLHPGDVILTGTPMGVGAETDEHLNEGDVVRVEIAALGRLTAIIGSTA